MKFEDCTECKECGSKKLRVYLKTHYRFQCEDCGTIQDGFILKSSIPENTIIGTLNQDLLTQSEERERAEFNQKRNQEREEKYAELANYYKSDDWAEKRRVRLRLNREIFDGLCERCGLAPADTIHHREYVLLGLEHPFDLEAICPQCHTLLHPDNKALLNTLRNDYE